MLYLLSYDRHTKRGTLGHLERFCEVASLLFQMHENLCVILSLGALDGAERSGP
jgi:hypothetical protein